MNVAMDKKSSHSHCRVSRMSTFLAAGNSIEKNKTSLRTPEGPSHLNYAPTANIENLIF